MAKQPPFLSLRTYRLWKQEQKEWAEVKALAQKLDTASQRLRDKDEEVYRIHRSETGDGRGES